MKFRAFILILALVMSLLSGCSSPQDSAQIAATTLPVYQFTTILCQGTNIKVARLITQSVSCLHDYTLQTAQMRTIENAKVIVLSGAGLEEFMEDTIPQNTVSIDASAGIPLLECSGHQDHDAHDLHHHEHDSHIWLSPANAKIMARNICEGLIEQFPEYQEIFEKNLTGLATKLDALQAYGNEVLAQLQHRELVTFHDGFAYFAQAFDLTILEAIEEESGSEVSAQELIRLISLVEDHRLPAIFTEVNGSVSAAQVLVRETGVKSFALDMVMAGEDYFEAMYDNINTVKEALE